MQVILKHSTYRIKNGFAVHSPEIGLTAHGYSPEIAEMNLERMVVMFMQPFRREGTLKDAINRMKIRTDGSDPQDSELIVTVE